MSASEAPTESATERDQVAAWLARNPDGQMRTLRGLVRSLAEYDALSGPVPQGGTTEQEQSE